MENNNLKELMSKPTKQLAEVAPVKVERVNTEDLENHELRIIDYEVLASKFREGGHFGIIRAIVDGKIVVSTVGETVVNQLSYEMLPVVAKLVRKTLGKGFKYWKLEA